MLRRRRESKKRKAAAAGGTAEGGPDTGQGATAVEEVDPRLRPIEDRLQRMDWPKPPPGTKERCLEKFMARLEEAQAEHGIDDGG